VWTARVLVSSRQTPWTTVSDRSSDFRVRTGRCSTGLHLSGKPTSSLSQTGSAAAFQAKLAYQPAFAARLALPDSAHAAHRANRRLPRGGHRSSIEAIDSLTCPSGVKGRGSLRLNKTHTPSVFGCLCPNRLNWRTPVDRNFSTTVQFKLDEDQQPAPATVDAWKPPYKQYSGGLQSAGHLFCSP